MQSYYLTQVINKEEFCSKGKKGRNVNPRYPREGGLGPNVLCLLLLYQSHGLGIVFSPFPSISKGLCSQDPRIKALAINMFSLHTYGIKTNVAGVETECPLLILCLLQTASYFKNQLNKPMWLVWKSSAHL